MHHHTQAGGGELRGSGDSPRSENRRTMDSTTGKKTRFSSLQCPDQDLGRDNPEGLLRDHGTPADSRVSREALNGMHLRLETIPSLTGSNPIMYRHLSDPTWGNRGELNKKDVRWWPR